MALVNKGVARSLVYSSHVLAGPKAKEGWSICPAVHQNTRRRHPIHLADVYDRLGQVHSVQVATLLSGREIDQIGMIAGYGLLGNRGEIGIHIRSIRGGMFAHRHARLFSQYPVGKVVSP